MLSFLARMKMLSEKQMLRNLALVIFCWDLRLSAYGSEAEENLTKLIKEGVGQLQFDSYTVQQAVVSQGQKLEFRFPFKEVGKAKVRILGIHQECGCLSQTWRAGQEVAAGEESVLIIAVDTVHFTGNFDKRLLVLTDEFRDKPHEFRMIAHIAPRVRVWPPLVELDMQSQKAQERTYRVVISPLSKQALHIEKIYYNEDNFDVSHLPSGENVELAIRWKGNALEMPLHEAVEIAFAGQELRVHIPIVNLKRKSVRNRQAQNLKGSH